MREDDPRFYTDEEIVAERRGYSRTYMAARRRLAGRRLLVERLTPEQLRRATNPDDPEHVGRWPEDDPQQEGWLISA
jgi:hypothetical protein